MWSRCIGKKGVPAFDRIGYSLAMVLALVANFTSFVCAQEQEPHITFYDVGTERVYLEAIPGVFFLMLDSPTGADAVAREISVMTSVVASQTRIPSLLRVTVEDDGGDMRGELRQWRRDNRVVWAEPGYLLDGRELTFAEVVDVKLASGYDIRSLDAINESLQGRAGQSHYTSITTHEIILDADRDRDALDVVAAYAQLREVEFADPRPVELESPFLSQPNDPFFPFQWGLDVIDAEAAWDVTTGAGVTVAVLDSGVDLTHPDLLANLDVVNGATFSGGSATPTGNGGATCDCVNAHGSNVAGIVAAVTNNNLGVAGTSQATILPIHPEADGSFTPNVRHAIFHARTNGAEIINMSFSCSPTSAVLQEIEAAATSGRNGRGIVLVAAAGNRGVYGGVDYPARDPYTIAVGASTESDSRVANELWTDPCDGSTYTWGSDYGEEIDLVAPGRGDLYSTDVAGSCGYTTGDYFSNFNGTSAASPFVAGVAALVLAIDPDLPTDGVRGYISDAADFVQGHTSWSAEYGWGRLNAADAVNAVYTRDPYLVYVDPSNVNVANPNQVIETGESIANGFNSYDEGVLALAAGGTLVLAGGTYAVPSPIDQPMTLTAAGGPANLNAQP